jgi:hypothetical protein
MYIGPIVVLYDSCFSRRNARACLLVEFTRFWREVSHVEFICKKTCRISYSLETNKNMDNTLLGNQMEHNF